MEKMLQSEKIQSNTENTTKYTQQNKICKWAAYTENTIQQNAETLCKERKHTFVLCFVDLNVFFKLQCILRATVLKF